MTNSFRLLLGTALAGGMVCAPAAFAQSTATQQIEEIVVSANVTKDAVGGVMTRQTAGKARSTVTQAFIARQTPGQTILQSINLIPGVNFTNNDAYGGSGGNLRIRGFDGPRVSLQVDGIPLNDTGNYAIFSNQQVDPELITKATVNLGTTDADSPTASATGGTVNYVTIKPSADGPNVFFQASMGSDKFVRIVSFLDTGLSKSGLGLWLEGSKTTYDKFKGPGGIDKWQVNGRLYQKIGDGGDFISVAFNYNENRNNFYRNLTKAQWQADPTLDNDPACARPAPQNGTVQNENLAPYSACTNYYNLRINPSNTGNIRMQSRFTLKDNLTLTVDPSYQYVLANGGGTSVISEKSPVLIGTTKVTGVDLNGDGDVLDSVRVYSPNTTNTNRFGLIASLIWQVDPHNLLRFGYTWDYGRHRQTGQYGPVTQQGNPVSVFAGADGPGIATADGNWLRGRDRLSYAKLNQFSGEYIGKFMEEKLTLNVGLRLPLFQRDLNQYCFTQPNGTQSCTTQPVVPPTWVAPYSATLKYNKLLPNLNVSYTPDTHNQFYGSFAQGLSAPRTDNLYNFQVPLVQPETTNTFDIGYRYSNAQWLVSTDGWYTQFKNRIVTSFDPVTLLSIDRNVGTVNMYGLDLQVGWQPLPPLQLYAFGSWQHSALQGDIQYNATTFVPTKGKQLVETPVWMVGGRAEYNFENFITLGAQAKYVGDRYATDVNDEIAPAYTVVDLDLRIAMDRFGLKNTWFQFNATNLFNVNYLGGVTTSRFSADVSKPYGAAPVYSVGAPQTFVGTVRVGF